MAPSAPKAPVPEIANAACAKLGHANGGDAQKHNAHPSCNRREPKRSVVLPAEHKQADHGRAKGREMHGLKPQAHCADNGGKRHDKAERGAGWANHPGLACQRERRGAHRQRHCGARCGAAQVCVKQPGRAGERDADRIAHRVGMCGAEGKA